MPRRVSGYRWIWLAFAASVALPWAGCGSTDTPPTSTGTTSASGSGGAGGVGGTDGATGTGGSGGLGGAGGTGGGVGGSGGNVSCGSDEKACAGQCVAVDDPAYGCTAAGCDPCGLPNADALCNAGACEIATCDAGFDNCDGDDANGCEVESSADPENCGACGNECAFPNADALCVGSACSLGACEAPFQDCDADAANGCEALVGSDPQHCSACDAACAPGEQCQSGTCGVFCPPGQANCDNDAANGCETPLGTLSDCGFCGDACDLANSSAACVGGACQVSACDAGHADCDGMPDNGCETNTDGSSLDCGACGVVCPGGPNGTPVCVQGGCGLVCDGGFEDCDGDAANGCEAATPTDVQNCGGCGVACVAQNGTPQCDAGQCEIASCAAGYADCNGAVADGCEANTQESSDHCGACGNLCPDVPNGVADCNAGACGGICDPGFADCNGAPADGCEVSTQGDAQNCGACGVACSVANGTPACVAGACAVGSCNPGYADCNGNAADGCETSTDTSLGNCGGCGLVCSVANGAPACVAGACVIAACNPGVGDCNGNPADGCETNIASNANNCGACGSVCDIPNGSPVCASGSCQIASCDASYQNCNGSAADGCEVAVNTDASNCGSCGNACSVANGMPACAGGACVVGACNSGFGDCNGNPSDGCEANTQTSTANCGACGNTCSIANGAPACQNGACSIASCSAGYANCNGNAVDGCEINTQTSTANCGACGNACSIANGAPACQSGSCAVASCNAGYANCDSNAANGCEVNTQTSTANCGACGNTCSAPNGAPACQGGSCAVASCNAGYGNCDGTAANGCEVNTQTSTANCGACGNTCSVANGTPACQGGSCAVASCNPGYANCDGSAGNGCETNVLSSAAHCGACGNACSVANGTPACAGGTCAIAGCNPGYGNCNGSAADGCETNLQTSTAHCGACGNTCSLPNAVAACSSGGCAIASCNAGYADCDGVAANGCEVNTQTSLGNCGACGAACSVSNGTAACLAGTCAVAGCNAGWGNCDGSAANGCESNLQTSLNSCGSCGNVCSVANGTPACSGGVCAVAGCNAGFANCNGAPADGCEINLTSDTANCGGCGNNCGSVCSGNIAALTCSAGSCNVAACNSSYYNVDGMCTNGCECQSSGASSTCALPSSLGTLNLGQSTSVSANVVPANNEDWYVVTFNGNTSTSYHPRVRFTSNPNNAFRFDIRNNCQGSSPACGVEGGLATSKTDWETFSAGSPGYYNPIPPVGNNGTILIRVYRAAGTPMSCDSYTLAVSN